MEKAFASGQVLEKNRESMRWFSEKVRKLSYTPGQFVRNDPDVYNLVNRGSVGPGRMYTFFYDPKWKNDEKKLPYYDRFPCIFVIEMYSDGFLGLNLHYLRYSDRADLLEALFQYQNNAKIEENKKLRISYDLVASFSKSKLAKHCVKRYLKPHIKSKLMKIDHQYWPIVSMLPIHEFEGKKFRSMNQVWTRGRNR